MDYSKLSKQEYDRIFEEILDKYERKIFNMIYRMVGNYDEAADLTQETFLRVYKGLRTFRGQSSLYTWIYQIALNLCRTKLAWERKKSRVLSLDQKLETEEGEELEMEVPDESTAPNLLFEGKNLQEAIQQALEALPLPYREVIVLHDLQGFSYEEMANMLGVNEQAIRVRLHRARKMLRELLEPYINK
ncbi:sigma-70 family RNA polymerase sigma factor [bacterium]|nr:sigma-70 family RNA polymerase sigma factor [bacterium]